MGNQAATLAFRQRQQIIRHLHEMDNQIKGVLAVLEAWTDEESCDETWDKLTDIHAISQHVMTRVDRWGAFLEVTDGDS